MKRELISNTVFRSGYEVRKEMVTYSEHEDPMEMRSAYSPEGGYIGDIKFANMLINKYGITTFKEHESESRVVCYGYSPANKKWYGWSHRAISAFGIGDMIFEESFGDDKTPFIKHGSVEIKTLEQAKEAAYAFARYVS